MKGKNKKRSLEAVTFFFVLIQRKTLLDKSRRVFDIIQIEMITR